MQAADLRLGFRPPGPLATGLPVEDRQLLTQGQILHGWNRAVGEKSSKQNTDCRKHAQSEAVLSMAKASIVAVKRGADKICKCL